MGGSESKGSEENGENQELSDTALAKESGATALAKGLIAGAEILALGAEILAVGASVASMMGDLSKSSEEKTMEDPMKKEKTMKAPWRDGRMVQHYLEKDPAASFSSLRRDKRKEKY